MSKLKRYFVIKTQYVLYEVYDESKEKALKMVKNKSSMGLAGLPNQKGYNTVLFNSPLEEYKVVKAGVNHA